MTLQEFEAVSPLLEAAIADAILISLTTDGIDPRGLDWFSSSAAAA